MRQSTSDIFKKMFPSLLIYLVILSVYTLITNLMGLGTEAIFTMPAPGEVAPPTFNPGGESFLAIILQLLYFIIVGLVGLGIVLSIYRIARYGTDVSFADQFYFFNPFRLQPLHPHRSCTFSGAGDRIFHSYGAPRCCHGC